jgi:hypothetical protein
MSTSPKLQIIDFGCHDTRGNLPAATSLKDGESKFLACFEAVYFESELRTSGEKLKFATGREFALGGFGRADILFMAWSQLDGSQEFSVIALRDRLKLTAIEAKIKDWRKGLMQAARYRFFANRSLLVLPPEAARIAVAFLPTFRDLNVGLWEFNATSNRLQKHFTPRSRRPLNCKAREKAVHSILSGLKLSQLGEL